MLFVPRHARQCQRCWRHRRQISPNACQLPLYQLFCLRKTTSIEGSLLACKQHRKDYRICTSTSNFNSSVRTIFGSAADCAADHQRGRLLCPKHGGSCSETVPFSIIRCLASYRNQCDNLGRYRLAPAARLRKHVACIVYLPPGPLLCHLDQRYIR